MEGGLGEEVAEQRRTDARGWCERCRRAVEEEGTDEGEDEEDDDGEERDEILRYVVARRCATTRRELAGANPNRGRGVQFMREDGAGGRGDTAAGTRGGRRRARSE